MINLEEALKAGRFLDQVSLSVKKIIFANFPALSEQEKEEIDQDVKLKLLKMAARGKKIDNLRSYIWKMVYSTALDTIARRAPADSLDDYDASPRSSSSPRSARSSRSPLEAYVDTLSPEYLFEEKELLSLVDRAIDALPPRRRSAVLLHLQGMSLEEIAVYLGESVNASRHLVYRGIDEVKATIAARSDPARARLRPVRLELKRT